MNYECKSCHHDNHEDAFRCEECGELLYEEIINGEVIKRSDSWDTIEQAYVDKCEDEHGGGTGRMLIGKHELVNNVIKEI